jgi:hypothetical protein
MASYREFHHLNMDDIDKYHFPKYSYHCTIMNGVAFHRLVASNYLGLASIVDFLFLSILQFHTEMYIMVTMTYHVSDAFSDDDLQPHKIAANMSSRNLPKY